ncbi:MAG: helicase HerA-like domain-containing protein [Flavobacteriales bacterium]
MTAAPLDSFRNQLEQAYTYKRDFFILGGAMLDKNPVEAAQVKIALKTLNRHGLIAGATGTGKTKTLQVIAEQLSLKGIPSVLMDIKGDLSGLAKPGESNDHIVWRHGAIGTPYKPEGLPVELMSISEEKGLRLRSTVSEFGPVLLSKILSLNDTQSGIIAIIFKYCDDQNLPLLDLKDLRKTLQYISTEGKKALEAEYGLISGRSVSAIMRKIIALEEQGAELFFGEKSFDVNDFARVKEEKGQISIIRLTDIQNKPKLFSTFMLSLLAEIYETFPEQGDSDKPKLCLFIDEAHLVFKEASKELLDQIEIIIKLIRSKGIGIFFCTQNPSDVPEAVLSQLGLKIQHALRAFTAKDRRSIKKTVENYPETEFYPTDQLITELGIGEAFVSALNEKGVPTMLTHTLLRAPISRMDILTPKEINILVKDSKLAKSYEKEIDRESAYEILSKKIEKAQEAERKAELEKEKEKRKLEERKIRARKSTSRSGYRRKSTSEKLFDKFSTQLIRGLSRGILGVLGIK